MPPQAGEGASASELPLTFKVNSIRCAHYLSPTLSRQQEREKTKRFCASVPFPTLTSVTRR